jgi:broad specificity phosphatase PhoE
MAHIHLIRHGQASFGAADYDQLSDLGHRQSVRLGEHLRTQTAHGGPAWDAVITGTLRRHRQTWAGIAEGSGLGLEPLEWPGLNEYDSEALIKALRACHLAQPGEPGAGTPHFKQHFRLLRDALTQWMAGTISPEGMPTYTDFVAGAVGALAHIRQHLTEKNVLVVSSGGPISTLVGHLLHTPPETTIELNLQIRNTAVTELVGTPKRQRLVAFNTLPHLQAAEHRDWITHA